MARVLPMRGQFPSEAGAASQMTFVGRRVEIASSAGTRFGTIFGVKSYPAGTRARKLDALKLPYDIVVTNSFTPARNNEIEESSGQRQFPPTAAWTQVHSMRR